MPQVDKATFFPIVFWIFVLYVRGSLFLNISSLLALLSSLKLAGKRAARKYASALTSCRLLSITGAARVPFWGSISYMRLVMHPHDINTPRLGDDAPTKPPELTSETVPEPVLETMSPFEDSATVITSSFEANELGLLLLATAPFLFIAIIVEVFAEWYGSLGFWRRSIFWFFIALFVITVVFVFRYWGGLRVDIEPEYKGVIYSLWACPVLFLAVYTGTFTDKYASLPLVWKRLITAPVLVLLVLFLIFCLAHMWIVAYGVYHYVAVVEGTLIDTLTSNPYYTIRWLCPEPERKEALRSLGQQICSRYNLDAEGIRNTVARVTAAHAALDNTWVNEGAANAAARMQGLCSSAVSQEFKYREILESIKQYVNEQSRLTAPQKQESISYLGGFANALAATWDSRGEAAAFAQFRPILDEFASRMLQTPVAVPEEALPAKIYSGKSAALWGMGGFIAWAVIIFLGF